MGEKSESQNGLGGKGNTRSSRGQGHLPLGQAAPSPVQTDLGQFQGWGNHSFFGLTTLKARNFFLISHLTLPSLMSSLIPNIFVAFQHLGNYGSTTIPISDVTVIVWFVSERHSPSFWPFLATTGYQQILTSRRFDPFSYRRSKIHSDFPGILSPKDSWKYLPCAINNKESYNILILLHVNVMDLHVSNWDNSYCRYPIYCLTEGSLNVALIGFVPQVQEQLSCQHRSGQSKPDLKQEDKIQGFQAFPQMQRWNFVIFIDFTSNHHLLTSQPGWTRLSPSHANSCLQILQKINHCPCKQIIFGTVKEK